VHQSSTTTPDVISVLRNTFRRLEESGAFEQDDPASIHLRRRLVLAIAELETQTGKEPSAKVEKPVVLLRMRKPIPPNENPELELCSKEDP
jgi:hypothetical protein